MSNVVSVIKKLKKINLNNIRLRKINKTVNEIKENISTLEQNVAREKKVLDDYTLKNQELEKKVREYELEIKTIEGKIKDLNVKKFMVKTQKEMDAMTKEIKIFKKKINGMEDFTLKSFDEMNEMNEKIKKQKELSKKAEANLNDKKEQLLKNIKEHEADYKEIEKAIEETQKTIDKAIITKVTKLSQRRAGMVLAKIINNSCEICGFNIPHQLINEVTSEKRLYQCPACSRILYIEN